MEAPAATRLGGIGVDALASSGARQLVTDTATKMTDSGPAWIRQVTSPCDARYPHRYMPGSYDDLSALVRREAEAEAVVLVVVNGKRGTSVSVTTDTTAGHEVHASLMEALPDQLEEIARYLRSQEGAAFYRATVVKPDFPRGD